MILTESTAVKWTIVGATGPCYILNASVLLGRLEKHRLNCPPTACSGTFNATLLLEE